MGIRPYQPADHAACRSLWVELTEWHRAIYASPGIGGDDPGSKFDEHLAQVGPGSLWVAEVDGAVAGLAGLLATEDGLEVEPVVVAAAHRRHGIGRRLVEVAVAEAQRRGAGTVSVRPVARNAGAVRFFRELGFDVVGHVELMLDLRPEPRPWVDGEELAGRRFRV